jgi:hypothetical protein
MDKGPLGKFHAPTIANRAGAGQNAAERNDGKLRDAFSARIDAAREKSEKHLEARLWRKLRFSERESWDRRWSMGDLNDSELIDALRKIHRKH